jgi:hypothetical protein
MSGYRARIADAELVSRLEYTGAVVIEGPKACGKTSTGRAHTVSEVLLDTDATARALLDVNPALILRGATPRLIDEWQTAPEIWNHVRRALDESNTPGQFILTGSAMPADDIVRHTGAGRIGRMRMRPMNSQESGFSQPLIRFSDLLEDHEIAVEVREPELREVVEEVCRGGWPGWRDLRLDAALKRNRDYIDEVCRTDIARVDGTARDPERVRQFARAYSRHIGTQAPISEMTYGSLDGTTSAAMHEDSARAYFAALDRLMLIEELPPWSTHLRSRARQLQRPKRYWVCPSLAVAALRATPAQLEADLPFFGLLFESMVVRDLQVLAQANDAALSQFRDSNGVEADVILQMADGRWGAIEVKLGMGQVDAAAASLLRFVAQIDTRRAGPPSFLAVIVGIGRWAYRRPDGVYVVPLAGLGC